MVKSKMKSLISLLSLLSLALRASAQNGIIGFGISMYPDLCCQACHDSLASLYLSCTSFEGHMDHDEMGGMTKRDEGEMTMTGMTSDECRASNKAWLETMAYCIQTNCNADGYPDDKQAQCFASQALGGVSKPTFQQSLPAERPTQELAFDAVWLNETSLVNAKMYFVNHGTLGEFVRSEEYHTKYAVSLIIIFIGTCLLFGITMQIISRVQFRRRVGSNNLSSKIKQHILLPALFPSSRRLEPLPNRAGYIPSRVLTISLTSYLTLNIIFSAVSFRSFQPNVWFLSAGFELCEYVGNRTGTLSLVNLALAILLSGRNGVLVFLTGWNQTIFLTLHRWVARIAVVQLVVHSIVYTAAYFQPGYEGAAAYAQKAAEPFYTWGIAGTVLLCLVVGLAILPIRARVYELFLATHVVLVVFGLVATWYHLVPHFEYQFGYQVWLYIAFAFWGWDHFVRIVRIGVYNHLLGGEGRTKATVEAVPGTDGRIMEITVYPRASRGFGRPGQHSFLSFPGLFWKTKGRVWENHPFSIAAWEGMPGQLNRGRGDLQQHKGLSDKEIETAHTAAAVTTTPRHPGEKERPAIKFLVRAHGGITSLLRQQVLASPSGKRLETAIFTEGPYAGHRATVYALYNADTIVCFAGGIGITHILGFVQEYVKERHGAGGNGDLEDAGESGSDMRMRARRLILAWSAKEMALIQHVRERFLAVGQEGGQRGLEVLLWCTGSPSSKGSAGEEKTEDPGLEVGHSAQRTDTDVQNGRMDIKAVLRGAVELGNRTAVMVCAPGAMADEVTRQTVNCLADGLDVGLVEEAFAW
ncbi:Ferric reductase like transmembrane component domain containing protein [Rhypophila sp. PSN 637]